MNLKPNSSILQVTNLQSTRESIKASMLEREDIAKELTGLPRVVEVIAKEVDDER